VSESQNKRKRRRVQKPGIADSGGDSIMSHVKAETKPGAIILMHDGGGNHLQTVNAIPKIVGWLFEQGYAIVTVDQIM